MSSRLTKRSYLTPAEAAALLGVSLSTVSRRIAVGTLPALTLSKRLRRIEAQALIPLARPSVPRGPAWVTTAWLSDLWRVHPKTLQRMAHARALPMRRRAGQWEMSRRALLAFVTDHTTGDRA